MTDARKRNALTAVTRRTRDAKAALEGRDDAIVRAREYASAQEIADAAGLTRQGVTKLLKRRGNMVDKQSQKA